MKKILITGGLGFIGTNFIKHLLEIKKYEILNLDKDSYCSNSSLKKKFKNYNYINLDISSVKLDKLRRIIKKFKPDYLVNFAANSHVDNSINNPLSFVKSNYVSTLNILVVLSRLKIKNPIFIQIGTDEIYGEIKKNQKKTFNENDNYFPSSPYSSSKAACNLLVKSFSRTYGIKYFIINPSNNYGPFQFKEKLIPKTILNILQNKSIGIYKKGENIRQWMFVEDTCEVIEKLITRANLNNTYNLGYGKAINNINLVKLIYKTINDLKKSKNKLKIKFVKDRKGHDFKYISRGLKIKKIINLKTTNINQGIKKTVLWYMKKDNLKLFK